MPGPEQAPPPGEGVTSPSGINSLPIPEQFDNTSGHCNQAERWAKWYRRFQRYRYASGLASKPEIDQVSTFLYAMGDIGDDILITLNIEEDKTTYK